jgi:cell division protein FtsQ
MARGEPLAAGRTVAAGTDRRFHRGDLRLPRRRRLGPFVWRNVRRLAPALAGLAGAAVVAAAALESDALRVSDIRVSGQVRLSTAEIDTRLDGLRGEHVLRVDFEEYRRRLRESPWVASVTFARVLPSTIDVRITERMPVAIARLGQQLYLVDESAVIMDEFGPQYQAFDLPIVDGLFREGAGDGPTLDPERVWLAAHLLSSLGGMPDVRGRVSQVDVTNPRDAAILLGGDSAWLHLGHEAFEERLRLYLDLGEALHARMPGLESVDLRFGGRIYVRASGAAAAR